MNTLLLGLLLFLGMHSARIVAEQGRLALQARIGAMAFKGLYAVVSLLGFYLVLKGYGETRLNPIAVWTPPKGMRHLAVLLMLPAMVLLVAAYIPRNALKNRLKHPMVLSVKVWALAHLSSNGNVADLVLFGSFLVWAVLCFRAARQRDRAAENELIETPGALRQRTLLTWGIGIAAWLALLAGGHTYLVGVSPLGM
jgi:uncharacterized membrane protein